MKKKDLVDKKSKELFDRLVKISQGHYFRVVITSYEVVPGLTDKTIMLEVDGFKSDLEIGVY